MQNIEKRIHDLERWTDKAEYLLQHHSDLWERYIPIIEDNRFKAAVALETNKVLSATKQEMLKEREFVLSKSGRKWVIIGITIAAIALVNPYLILLVHTW